MRSAERYRLEMARQLPLAEPKPERVLEGQQQEEESAAAGSGKMSRLKRPLVQGEGEATRAWIAALTCLIVILGGYVASGKIPGVVPGPQEVKVIPPSPHLAPKLAALSGIWESPQGEILPSRLVVEQIDPTWASIIYFWGDDPTGSFRGGWKRVKARVLLGGKLRWGHPGKFTVEISEDGLSLEGKKEQAGRVSTFTMSRAAPRIGQ